MAKINRRRKLRLVAEAERNGCYSYRRRGCWQCHGIKGVGGTSRSSVHGVGEAEELIITSLLVQVGRLSGRRRALKYSIPASQDGVRGWSACKLELSQLTVAT